MSSRVVKLKDFTYCDHEFDLLWLILDEHGSPPILPLLFTTFISRFGFVYKGREISDKTDRKRISQLIPSDISDPTIRTYVYCLAEFLNYLEYCRTEHQTPGMHLSSSCNQRFVNHYLNNIQANVLQSSKSLDTHRSALMAYFNWLDYMGISVKLDLKIERKTRQAIAANSTKQHYIQYVSHYWRTKLLNTCETLAEKLIIRMGFEVGLRTAELVGLRVPENDGLTILFKQLDNKDYSHRDQFRYWLEGKYAKNSTSRWIYFDRLLLIDMRRYFRIERQRIINQTNSKDTSFFLRTDQRFIGTGIGKAQGTNVFRNRSRQTGINSQLSFHDLRHTFATELYHAELAGPDGRETRSESAALIVVAQRLGHAFGRNGQAPAVTTKYIRMRLQMLEMEEIVNE